jgi:hypothetical protein
MCVLPPFSDVSWPHQRLVYASYPLQVCSNSRAIAKRQLIPFTAFIPLWVLPTKFGALSAGAFFLQFGVQGAWGIVSQIVQLVDPDLSSSIVIGADSTGGIVTSVLSSNFSWCCISIRKCDHLSYSVENDSHVRNQMISSASAQIEASMCAHVYPNHTFKPYNFQLLVITSRPPLLLMVSRHRCQIMQQFVFYDDTLLFGLMARD